MLSKSTISNTRTYRSKGTGVNERKVPLLEWRGKSLPAGLQTPDSRRIIFFAFMSGMALTTTRSP
jgi:hypothetical protein